MGDLKSSELKLDGVGASPVVSTVMRLASLEERIAKLEAKVEELSQHSYSPPQNEDQPFCEEEEMEQAT